MNFIDFITNANTNPELIKEFKNVVSQSSTQELKTWFNEKGYITPIDECNRILENREMFIREQVIPMKLEY